MATSNNGKLFASEDFDKNHVSEKIPKKPWWPWALAAVVVCGGLVFLLTRGNGPSGDEVAQTNVPLVEDIATQDNPATTTQDSVMADTNNVASATVNGTVEEEAWSTIRGNYGNGAARKEALGSRYDEIQAKVNEFYREGKVH